MTSHIKEARLARGRNALGLSLSRFHEATLRGTSRKISRVVAAFIETESRAQARLEKTVRCLSRRASGRRLADKLQACGHDRSSGLLSSCFVCARLYRIWLLPQIIAFAQAVPKSWSVTVLIRDIPAGELAQTDLALERDAFRKRLQRCGFPPTIANIEIAYKPEGRAWNLHAHMLVFAPCAEAGKRLRKAIDFPRSVKCEAVNPSRRVRQISYLFKFVTYYRHPQSPRVLPLPDQPLAELTLWRNKYRLLDHLVLIGFQRRGVIVPGPTFRQIAASSPKSGDVETSPEIPAARAHAQRVALDAKLPKRAYVSSFARQTHGSPGRADPNKLSLEVDVAQTNSTRVMGWGVGADGDAYLRISYRSGGRPKERLVAAADLTSNSVLRSIGVLTPASRSALSAEAETALRNMPSAFDVADRSGWCDGTYVYPDGGHTGSDEVPICLRPEYRDVDPMRDDGTLKGWREIANLARRNTRLMLVIAHAFTGPVASLFGLEAPAIQLVGEAGVFKTSVASVIAAIWGANVLSWHQTPYVLEKLALSRHAAHLVLDDFRVDDRHPYTDLRARAIRLLDGRSKGRMGEKSLSFCTPILSTSNRTLDEHARLAGLASDADQAAVRGRLLDVPLSGERAVMFEDLHGQSSGLDLIFHLDIIAQDNPGRPAIKFIDRLRERLESDKEAVRREVDEHRRAYEERARATFESPAGYDLTRAHGRFATIYATGMLLISLRLVRWSNAYLLDAILACEDAHIRAAARGGRGDLEGSPMTALQRHIEAHHSSFVDLRKGLLDRREHDHVSSPAYINLHRDGTLELLFTLRQIETICGSRAAINLLRTELRQAGALIEGDARPSVKRFIYRGKDPEERLNFMALRANAFRPFATCDSAS